MSWTTRFRVRQYVTGSLWVLPFMMAAGVLLLTVLMHLARGVGQLHAQIAKALLVDHGRG